jgi:putative ABC transport system permease protein
LEAGVPPGRGEAVLDELVADDLGLPIGSDATVLGTPLKVAGLTSSGTSITNTTVFVSLDQFAEMRGATVSYVLVGAVDGTSATQLAAQVAAALPGTTVQTRAQFVAAESSIVSSMSADLLVLMNLIGLLIALAVVALGLLTSTLARLRDYAVLKAVGARTWELVGTVASQVLWTVGLALVLATGLALVLARLVPVLAPTVLLSVTPESVLTTGLGALAAGLIAALLPLLRLTRVDAATAFRERQ